MTYRTLTSHQVNPANDTLSVTVIDQPGSGGAHHLYLVGGMDPEKNPSFDCPELEDWVETLDGYDAMNFLPVMFQNGPINENGVNGLTHEILLAILIDRLECFQAGPFANTYNARALVCLQEAQNTLLERTRERMARGVEGTHQL